MTVLFFLLFFLTAHAGIKAIENGEYDKAIQKLRPIKWVSLGSAILFLLHEFLPQCQDAFLLIF